METTQLEKKEWQVWMKNNYSSANFEESVVLIYILLKTLTVNPQFSVVVVVVAVVVVVCVRWGGGGGGWARVLKNSLS